MGARRDPFDEDHRDDERGYRETSLRELRLRDWLSAPPDDRRRPGEFQRLVWRLEMKRRWAALPPEKRAQYRAYRDEWAKRHRDRVRASARKAKAKRRDSGKTAAESRARRARARELRRAATVYVCAVCGAEWCQLGRIPSRPPKYCTQSCRGRANYLRMRARGTR